MMRCMRFVLKALICITVAAVATNVTWSYLLVDQLGIRGSGHDSIEHDNQRETEVRLRTNAAFTLNKCKELIGHADCKEALLSTRKSELSRTLQRFDDRWLLTPIPGRGWSKWLQLILKNAGRLDLKEESVWDVDYLSVGYKVSTLTDIIDSGPRKYEERVVFTRNPYERLVSAYRDKAVGGGGSYLRRVRSPCYWYKQGRTEILSFKQFCHCVITKAKYYQKILGGKALWHRDIGINLDQHWGPQAHLAMPCGTNYTLISKYETFEADSSAVTTLMNLTVDHKVVHQNQSSDPTYDTQSAALKEWYYSQLTSSMIADIQELYKLDFQLFGYDSTSPNDL